MMQNYKEIDLKSVEMIDDYYFFIQKRPEFFCLEIICTDTFAEQKNILNKIIGDKRSLENDVGIIFYLSTENDENIINLVYKSYSLKALKYYTANSNLALEDDIKKFIKILNNNSK